MLKRKFFYWLTISNFLYIIVLLILAGVTIATLTGESVVYGVIIPDGFYYVGGTRDTGLVISDVEEDNLDNSKQGNQFVWVPVDNYSDFIRREGYYNGSLQSYLSSCGEANSTGKNSKVTETATTQVEAQEMYASVTSTLIYGVQWDAVMKWMENIENPNATGSLTKYIQDSTGMGWYSDNSGDTIHKTGIDVDNNKSNCVNNIYDLAGNINEWTMECYNTLTRIVRGGGYSIQDLRPASYRNDFRPSVSNEGAGFRITLYL